MPRTWKLLITVLCVIGLGAPASAGAATWTISTSVVNNTGNSISNCPSSAPGSNCIFVQGTPSLSQDGVWSSGSDYPADPPWGAIAASWGTWDGTDTWKYYAPYFGYGADAYVTYAMPDGSLYYVTIEDDLDGSIGDAGANMYAACLAGQVSSGYVCTPNSGNYQAWDFDPSITFSPPDAAPTMAAGQTCSGTVAGGQSVDCTGTGQFSGPIFLTVAYFANPGSVPITVTDTTTGQSCNVDPMTTTSNFPVCSLETSYNDNDDITITPQDPSAPAAEIQAQVYALAPTYWFAGAFGQLLNGLWGSLGGGDDGDDAAAAFARAIKATPTSDPKVFRVAYPSRPLTPPKGRHHTQTVQPPDGARRRIETAYRSPVAPRHATPAG